MEVDNKYYSYLIISIDFGPVYNIYDRKSITNKRIRVVVWMSSTQIWFCVQKTLKYTAVILYIMITLRGK